MKPMTIHKVWIDDTAVYAETDNGLVAKYMFAHWPLLKNASQAQREDFYLSFSGIHWPQIDEDLSFEGMFANANLCSRTPGENSIVYMQ